MSQIMTFVLGPYGANCYLLWKEDHVLIVDPGSKSAKIKEVIDRHNAVVDGIYLTHGHFDHIAGADVMAQQFQCDIYINAYEMPLLYDPRLNLSSGIADIVIKQTVHGLDLGKNDIGNFHFELIDAPGHTDGSCLMVWEGNMICGDVLFEGSIGRTDLPTGSNTKMYQTLQKIVQMDPDLIIYPGHGNATTLQKECMTNPFLTAL